jgi:CPA1 family monovalent cation:H+ antiporter
VLVSLIQRLAARVALPVSVLLAGAGIALGTFATIVQHAEAGGVLGKFALAFSSLPIGSDAFIYILLPALLFQSALTIEVPQMLEDAAPILLLAIVAVVVATVVIGFALAPFAGVSIIACLALGAIVATTDPVAVIAIFRDVGAPSRLIRLVEGESLLNDAAAITLFAALLEWLLGGHHSAAATAVEFVRTLVGGVVIGLIGARLVIALLSWLRDLRPAQVTLTLALPYVVFIVGQYWLDVSGVVAAVTAGLVLSALGQPKIAPADWRFLHDLWEQLAFWASSLIFILASLMVPKLLLDVGWSDLISLLVLVIAALAGRAVVLWGLMPLLSGIGLSQRVDNKYKVVILWGGLRGAVTLALALAVTETAAIPHDVQRFIAVLATGFVLFTLLVQGLTLRPLIRVLRLDRLSPADQALRAQVLALSRRRVVDAVRTIGQEYKFDDELIANAVTTYQPTSVDAPLASAAAEDSDGAVRLGLVALASRERELVLQHFAARTASGRIVEELLEDVDRLIERTRTRGHGEYVKAAEQTIEFSWQVRFAQVVHRRLGIQQPLVDRLADRFERLLVSRIVLEEVAPYIGETLMPLVGERAAETVRGALRQRQQMTDAALEALRAQYGAYSHLLEQRFLNRVALRREDLEYRTLFDERLIGPELFGALGRDLQTARTRIERRPHLDLGLDARALVAHVQLLAGLTPDQLDRVARLLRPRLAVPDERLIAAGDRGDAMYFIASGVVTVKGPGQSSGPPILLTRGDFFGEMALVLDQPRQADVIALSYCQLLVLERRDFQGLVRSHRAIRTQIERAVADRARMNEARPESSP